MFSMKTLAGVTLAASMAVAIPTATATAQQNRQRGLVNVAVFEVIDDVTIVVQDINVSVGVAPRLRRTSAASRCRSRCWRSKS